MKNTGIHEGPVRKGGLSNNNSSNKPDITPAGQGLTVADGTIQIDKDKLIQVISQIDNAILALYAGDKGSSISALKKAKRLIIQLCDYKE
jgi:signal transduction histidine kinase